jgi:hypothetical protein
MRTSYSFAGADDFLVAEAIYRVAIERWPRARITLRQGTRVVRDIGGCNASAEVGTISAKTASAVAARNFTVGASRIRITRLVRHEFD